jgi:hypothetical protein
MKSLVFWDVKPCGSLSQKTTFLIATAVNTSNFTSYEIVSSPCGDLPRPLANLCDVYAGR